MAPIRACKEEDLLPSSNPARADIPYKQSQAAPRCGSSTSGGFYRILVGRPRFPAGRESL
jgi:hypothetical protein